MTNPTVNRAYDMPASTDLVTNLPADFAVFGDAVDLDISSWGGYTTVATAAGTTTLIVTSNRNQRFTGVTTQTVTMPVASTLAAGARYVIQNKSTGIVTVNSSGGNAIYAIPAGATAEFVCILASGTTAASWDYDWAGASAAPGASAVTLISTTTLVATQTTISFAAIAATYKQLRIEWSADAPAGLSSLLIRFNADAAANYDYERVSVYATSITAAESFAATSIDLGTMGGTVCAGIINIPDYKGTVLNKTVMATWGAKSGTATTNVRVGQTFGSWRNTAAITQIDLTNDSGDFQIGSVFSLYGVN